MEIDVAFRDCQVETFWSLLDWETDRDEMSTIHGDPIYFQFNGIETEDYRPQKEGFNQELLGMVSELGYFYRLEDFKISGEKEQFFFGDGNREKTNLRIWDPSNQLGDSDALYTDKELFEWVVARLKGGYSYPQDWKKPENQVYNMARDVYRKFWEISDSVYNRNYESDLPYSDAVDIFDRTIKENADFISEFVRLRGDLISSDWEAAAFVYAVRKECEKFPWLKEIVRCE